MKFFSQLNRLLSQRYLPSGKYGRVRIVGSVIEFAGHDRQISKVDIAQVVRIEAFKHDLFSYDEITLALIDAAGGSLLVGEEDAGYGKFLEMLPAHFPGIRTDWYPVVAQPPMLENRTLLWERSSRGGY